MIDRRTFLKLSAGALVLTAAGAFDRLRGNRDRQDQRCGEDR